jgi:hypothetical protein
MNNYIPFTDKFLLFKEIYGMIDVFLYGFVGFGMECPNPPNQG